MTLGRGPHVEAFATEYKAITVRARQIVKFPPILRGMAEPLLPKVCESDFS